MTTLQQETPLRARPSHRPRLAGQAGAGRHRIDDLPRHARRPAWAEVPGQLSPEQPARIAVMLHGSGGEPQQGLELLGPIAVQAGWILVAPASRDYTWDGVLGRMGPDVESIDAVLHWVFERFVIEPRRLTIGGFSDGASYALSLGLGNGALFGRVLALSPGFIPPVVRRGKPRVYVSHGTGDTVLPIDRCSRRIVPALERDRYEVRYREFDGGHVIPPTIAQDAMRWLQDAG